MPRLAIVNGQIGVQPSCNMRRMVETAARIGAIAFIHRFRSSLC
jgi:hypothetical protein